MFLYSVVLVPAVWQSESALQIHTAPLLQIPSPLGRQSITGDHLCCTVGSHQPPILVEHILVLYSSTYMSIPISQFTPPSLCPLGVHISVLYICVSISALQISSSVPFWPQYIFKKEGKAAVMMIACPKAEPTSTPAHTAHRTVHAHTVHYTIQAHATYMYHICSVLQAYTVCYAVYTHTLCATYYHH